MPICSDPNATTDISLRVDEDLPIESRPMFTSRFLTRKQANEVTRLCDQAFDEDDDAKCFDLLVKAIRIGIVGWKNFNDVSGAPIVFTEDGLAAVLTQGELWEVARNYPSYVAIQESRLRKKRIATQSQTSGSQSQSLAVGTVSAPVATESTAANSIAA